MSFAPIEIDPDLDFVGKPMTVEEFLSLPEDDIDRELIRGELREYGMTVRSRWHGRTEAALSYFLIAWLRQQPEPRGEIVSGEAGFWLRGDKDSQVGIDIAYVSNELIASTPAKQGTFDGPPLLAIEILSSSDTVRRIAEKVEVYLEAGVTTWIVSPEFRTVAVHRPNSEVKTYNRDDELVGDPELPGFRLKLAELFPG